MGEYLRNAWSGWRDFVEAGKYAALFIVSAGYLFLSRRQRGPQRRLVLYGSIAAVLCICPVTAAALMQYQTLFYDYPWIWSFVPLTAVIALGGTVFLTDQWEEGSGYRSFGRKAALTLLCVGTLALCGGLGRGKADTDAVVWRQEYAADVLEEVKENCGEDFCLWAPREILEYARSLDGGIRLLYGRNMWDAALNAYSYDVYSPEVREMYLWMEKLWGADADIPETGISEAEFSETALREQVQKAFRLGADCILLPGTAGGNNRQMEAVVESVAREDGVEMVRLDGYYLLKRE